MIEVTQVNGYIIIDESGETKKTYTKPVSIRQMINILHLMNLNMNIEVRLVVDDIVDNKIPYDPISLGPSSAMPAQDFTGEWKTDKDYIVVIETTITNKITKQINWY